MALTLSRAEQETHLNQTGEDRINNVVHVYTDDPVMINKMEKDGWAGKPNPSGGMHYVCENARMGVYRKRSMDLTEEQRQEIAERLQNARE